MYPEMPENLHRLCCLLDFQTAIWCKECSRDFDPDTPDVIDSFGGWCEMAGRQAHESGWVAVDELTVLCPQCAAKANA
jgi:Zn finger protein HypA/HybF involved in hydrogenase expression